MDLIQYLIAPYKEYSVQFILLESIAVIFGVWSVLLSIRKHIGVYPTGIISTALYVYILFKAGLIGDTLINFYYTVMSIYGWIMWNKVKIDEVHIRVSRTSKKEWIICAWLFLFSIVAVSIIYYYKPLLNVSDKPAVLGWDHLDWANYLDIFTTSIFLVGMWLMAKQKVENWLFWIVGDLICIPMMLYKSLGLTALQYLIFTILAINGYIKWQRSIAHHK
ncbi:nicotinamide riboside transporter PnuC [Taibaiella sp. KBW10]|uniref:nicotinamide riboside transporter PnuC n=1 Tax=Taibaiella sp. KBW10 TaxID=2153357 RepID=UPI000F593A63|nr:nicotinamide riboside transporter PnuC [Taibaiella sp. KBW10]RQO30709.1 nicotinamide riboside transporter PnuC [Taibaiella sp. KBW10]